MSTRPYQSRRREAQAEATRHVILDAAQELFLANGYNGTSIRSVAVAAGVSEPTIYKVFGDKPSLLVAVGDRVISIAFESSGRADVDIASSLRAETDPLERIRLAATWSRMTWEQGMLDFESMLLDAAGADARAAEVADHVWQRKYEENKHWFALVFPPESLPKGDDFDEIYDLFFALDSASFVRILVRDRGWTYDDYERWLIKILRRLFTQNN